MEAKGIKAEHLRLAWFAIKLYKARECVAHPSLAC